MPFVEGGLPQLGLTFVDRRDDAERCMNVGLARAGHRRARVERSSAADAFAYRDRSGSGHDKGDSNASGMVYTQRYTKPDDPPHVRIESLAERYGQRVRQSLQEQGRRAPDTLGYGCDLAREQWRDFKAWCMVNCRTGKLGFNDHYAAYERGFTRGCVMVRLPDAPPLTVQPRPQTTLTPAPAIIRDSAPTAQPRIISDGALRDLVARRFRVRRVSATCIRCMRGGNLYQIRSSSGGYIVLRQCNEGNDIAICETLGDAIASLK